MAELLMKSAIATLAWRCFDMTDFAHRTIWTGDNLSQPTGRSEQPAIIKSTLSGPNASSNTRPNTPFAIHTMLATQVQEPTPYPMAAH